MQGTCGVQGILGIPQPINEPPFTEAERDRRWSVLRGLMEERGVDVLIVLNEWQNADTLYIADTQGVTIFPRDEPPTLILGGEASHFAVKQPSWVDDRVTATLVGSTASPYSAAVVDALTRRGLFDRKIAVSGLHSHSLASVRQPDGYASYTTVKAIADVASQPIEDGTPILGEARYVKSEEEISRLTASLRVSEAAIEAMLSFAAEGVEQAEVYGQMLLAEVRSGADELHVAWCSGLWGQHRHRHVTTPPGKLVAGTYVSVELMPEIRGYQAQAAQPLVIGEPNSQAQEIFEINARAFDRACAVLKPGATWGEVEDEVTAIAHGTPYEINLLLHGRGLGNDGPLLIPAGPGSHLFARDFVVQANTAFILKPFSVPRDAESPITRAYDVTWGDTIVIREDGAHRLGTRERYLPSR
jgi:Xaa-Pro dipeptidase